MTGKQFTKTLLENSWLKASKTEANSIISLETDSSQTTSLRSKRRTRARNIRSEKAQTFALCSFRIDKYVPALRTT